MSLSGTGRAAHTGRSAVGALVGGWAVAGHGGIGAMVTGPIFCAVAVPLSWATSLLRPPTNTRSASIPVAARSAA
jgi:hypothetical protein